MKWPHSRHRKLPNTTVDESWQAVADSQLIRETAQLRWHRVNAAADRAEEAGEKVRSQREQNHLAEIVRAALLGGRHK